MMMMLCKITTTDYQSILPADYTPPAVAGEAPLAAAALTLLRVDAEKQATKQGSPPTQANNAEVLRYSLGIIFDRIKGENHTALFICASRSRSRP